LQFGQAELTVIQTLSPHFGQHFACSVAFISYSLDEQDADLTNRQNGKEADPRQFEPHLLLFVDTNLKPVSRLQASICVASRSTDGAREP
jgi:hypothetical protein